MTLAAPRRRRPPLFARARNRALRHGLGLLLLTGCATRSVPAPVPASAASSLEAPEAKPAEVSHALAGDPPLPGEPAAAWRGLREENAAATGEQAPQHGDHSGHVQPAQEPHGGHHHHGAH